MRSHIANPTTIIRAPRWPEPVEVNLTEDLGAYVRVVGVLTGSGAHVDQLIPRAEFDEIAGAEAGEACSAAPWQVFLALEATRYRFAARYDPLLAMNVSKVDPLPHQIEAVYGYVLKLPRIRFLIADDPGAGKTIMAGLIIKELKLRHLARRILIVAPGHLKDQWRRELSDRFAERFVVVDRGLMDALYGENVWLREHQVITSIDFAKRDEVLPSITAARFDLVIVDEAHKMSAYRYGDKLEKTSRYRLGEALAAATDHLLFLTATPHKGDPDNFRLFLDLLEPGFFATNEAIQESIRAKDNPLFIRRIKEDLRDFAGQHLFLPRYVETVPFNLGVDAPPEKKLYNDLSRYVEEQYNRALTKDKRRNIAFALVILQRRLASSTYALHKSLERRKNRLEELLQGAEARRSPISPQKPGFWDPETVEDMSEEERWREEEIWETLSVAENRAELREEIKTIDHLLHRAREVIQTGELKLRALRESLETLRQKYPDAPDRKVLIFTESRDTLEYLARQLQAWGYKVNTIHGGMRLEERVSAEAVFKHETAVLVATEAAGEGINLQFCHLMINYDIPWNPNRLEQRLGRIHRYGQQKEVYVFNLVAEDTREGKVLHKLFSKLAEIQAALGHDKVFDVLSDVLYGQNLAQLLLEAAANARSVDEIIADLDVQVDAEYLSQIKEHMGESLATRYIDYTQMAELAARAREYRLIPEYTESFFRKAFHRAGGKLRARQDGFLALEAVPFALRDLAQADLFRKTYGELHRRYPKVTFDKERAFKNPAAEFVSFGHPLFEAVLAWIHRDFAVALLAGAVFVDPDGALDGYVLFYAGEIRDGTGDVAGQRLFACYTDGQEVRQVSPTLIWDLAEGAEDPRFLPENGDLDTLKQQATAAIIPALEQYQQELQAERQHQAAIKEKYGGKSLEYLIVKLDGELIALYDRKERGESVDLVIRNKEERKAEYERALVNLRGQVQQERSLTMSMPRFVGIIRVVPAAVAADERHSSPEIELIGMKVAMAYERQQGRAPEDVAAENLGYDVRSRDAAGNVRYIEVKGRAGAGAVALTQNEWFKAQRFGADYYLYAVLHAATAPQLYIVPDPAQHLAPAEQIEVRYVVSFGDLSKYAA